MYYIIANQFDGKLIQAAYEQIEPAQGQLCITFLGDIPDLDKYEWHPGSLAFIEKNLNRFVTQTAFLNRLLSGELKAIYTMAKSNLDVEIWLDRFKMAKEIHLDNLDLQMAFQLFELSGIVQPGRSLEIFK